MKNAAALYKKVMENQKTRDRLVAMTDRGEILEEIMRLGMEYGLPVTRDEILQFLSMDSESEMSDQELESVVGGKGSIHEEIKGDSSFASWVMIKFGNYTSSVHNDNLSGGEGNDTVYGGSGSDTIDGGVGNDVLHGYGYSDEHGDSDRGDLMDGGAGNDTMYGDGGDDTMEGGTGNDRMYGGTGDDEMDGGAGSDYMNGGTGDDDMDGGAGNDYMSGGAGNDYMSGGAGNDDMDGGAGNDEMYGGQGNDDIDGGAGNDDMSGGQGNDTLTGGEGADTLTGGEGADTFVFGRDSGSDTITDFNPAEDKINFHGLNSTDEIEVSAHGGRTYISYGDTSIVLEGVEMDKDQVLGCME